MRPNALVIGAHKAATTSFCDRLSQHPDIFFSQEKELCFFSDRFERGIEWYESNFASAGMQKIRMEGTTQYSIQAWFPEVPSRINQYLGTSIKLIYLVRHPLDRIESSWMQWRSEGKDIHPDFHTAVRYDQRLIDASMYWKQLQAYQAFFDENNILVMTMEDFISDITSVMRRAFEFLEVDPDFETQSSEAAQNRSDVKRLESGLLWRLKRMPCYKWIYCITPGNIRALLKNNSSVFTYPTQGARPVWTPELRRWAIDRLSADTASILNYLGKPDDYWLLKEDMKPHRTEARQTL